MKHAELRYRNVSGDFEYLLTSSVISMMAGSHCDKTSPASGILSKMFPMRRLGTYYTSK